MATVPDTIRHLREQTGLSRQEVAKRIWMNTPSYYDLETYEDEWEDVAELGQLLELSRILETPLLTIVGESVANIHEQLSFPSLADLIRQEVTEGRVREDEIGWDLSEFWEEPMIAMEYPVSFLKIVGKAVGFDWRCLILFYQDADPKAAIDG